MAIFFHTDEHIVKHTGFGVIRTNGEITNGEQLIRNHYEVKELGKMNFKDCKKRYDRSEAKAVTGSDYAGYSMI
jgi:hypothetical protein